MVSMLHLPYIYICMPANMSTPMSTHMPCTHVHMQNLLLDTKLMAHNTGVVEHGSSAQCMSVHMSTHMKLHMSTRISVHTSTSMSIHIRTCTSLHSCLLVYMCIHMHICTCLHSCLLACMSMHMLACMSIHMPIHIPIHTSTYIPMTIFVFTHL